MTKIFKVHQEISFFESLGIDLNIMITFGLVQFAAGVLVLLPKLRKIGAIVAAIYFGIFSTIIFGTRKIGFALFSILPTALELYILKIDKVPEISS